MLQLQVKVSLSELLEFLSVSILSAKCIKSTRLVCLSACSQVSSPKPRNRFQLNLTVLTRKKSILKFVERIEFSSVYEGVSKSFRTESITKYTLTTINSR
jgi:hypothetical protein